MNNSCSSEGNRGKNDADAGSSEIISSTKTFTVSSIKVEDVFANVTIKPHNEKETIVKINGKKKHIDKISVTEKDGKLIIKNIPETLRRYIVVNINSSKNEKIPEIIILTPANMNIDVSDIFGNTEIGYFTGTLNVKSGMGNTDIEKISRQPILNLDGMGSITVQEFNGELSLTNSGHGNFSITSGEIKNATLTLTGMGNVTTPKINGKLVIKNSGHGEVVIKESRDTEIFLSGMGNVAISEVNGNLTINTSGQGEVEVRDGKVGNLYIKSSNMGDVVFQGEAENADLNCSGMGSIEVRKVKNRPYTTRKGMGDVEVGNW